MKDKFLDYDQDWPAIKAKLDFLVDEENGIDQRDAAMRSITILA